MEKKIPKLKAKAVSNKNAKPRFKNTSAASDASIKYKTPSVLSSGGKSLARSQAMKGNKNAAGKHGGRGAMLKFAGATAGAALGMAAGSATVKKLSKDKKS